MMMFKTSLGQISISWALSICFFVWCLFLTETYGHRTGRICRASLDRPPLDQHPSVHPSSSLEEEDYLAAWVFVQSPVSWPLQHLACRLCSCEPVDERGLLITDDFLKILLRK